MFVLCYRRISQDRANLRISRDRANQVLDLQMISHQMQKDTETQSDDSASLSDSGTETQSDDSFSASLSDSLPAERSTSPAKATVASPSSSTGQSVAEQGDYAHAHAHMYMYVNTASLTSLKETAASLPTDPPSSSTGQSVAELEVTTSGAADNGVAPAAPAPLAAPTVGPSPSLGRASSSAPPKRPAQPESASARRAKKPAFTSPWHVYCQEQRPLLMPLGMRNRDREKLLGVLASYI